MKERMGREEIQVQEEKRVNNSINPVAPGNSLLCIG
jgi:hypothetical protein